MMKIRIIAVGALKNKAFSALAEEYAKRLTPYAKVEIIEIAHVPFKEGMDRERVKEQEAELIRSAISRGTRNPGQIIKLDEHGKEFSSEDFARALSKWSEPGEQITFVIGGALGLHSSLATRNSSLSLSKLTFPHELARVLLLEQLYRAVTIMKGKTYHY